MLWQFAKKENSISIHAPREGGDGGRQRRKHWRGISIHAPREGGDAGRQNH